MKIAINKRYTTRDGREVFIATTEAKNGTNYVVQGHIKGEPPGYIFNWLMDGHALTPEYSHKNDLIEVIE